MFLLLSQGTSHQRGITNITMWESCVCSPEGRNKAGGTYVTAKGFSYTCDAFILKICFELAVGFED